MDIRMPGMDGLEAARLITSEAAPAPKVVMLTTFDLDDYVLRGAAGRRQRLPAQGLAPARPDRRRPGGRRR